MSSKNTGTSIQDVVSAEITKHLTPLQGLLEQLAKPASRAGMSPQDFLAKMTDGGNRPGLFGPGGMGHDGAMLPVRPESLRARRSKGLGWGDMWGAMAALAQPGITMERASNIQKKLFDPVEQGGYGLVPCNQKAVGPLMESGGVTGGYTVAPQFSNQLRQLAVEDSIVDSRASKVPIAGRSILVPSLDYSLGTAGQSAFLGGVVASWTSEMALREETEPRFHQTELTAWELSFYTVASNNLLADNAVGLDSILTQLFSMAISWYTDYNYFSGNGVGKPMGVINAPATVVVDRATNGRIRYVDIVTMLSRLLMQSWDDCVWVAHQSALPDLLQLNDNSGNQTDFGAGRLLWASIDQGAAKPVPASLLGRPLIFTEKVPQLAEKGAIGLYDFSKYLLGTRMDIEVAMSPHVKFLNNASVWRVVWRGDGQPWLPTSVTLAGGAGTYTVSPFVVLDV